MEKFLLGLIVAMIAILINAGLFMWVFNGAVASWLGVQDVTYGLAIQIAIIFSLLTPFTRNQ